MPSIRLVIMLVGATLLVSVVGIVYLAAATTSTIPDVLQNIAIGALTGLVGLLVPNRE